MGNHDSYSDSLGLMPRSLVNPKHLPIGGDRHRVPLLS